MIEHIACRLVAVAAVASLAAACGGNSMPTPMPDMAMPKPLDCTNHTTTAKLSSLKKDVFKPLCASFTACHEPGVMMGGMELANDPYMNLVTNSTPMNDAAKAEGLKRVVPGDPDHSFLVIKLSLPDNATVKNNKYGQLMPNGQRLDADTFDDIRCWIKNGAQNN